MHFVHKLRQFRCTSDLKLHTYIRHSSAITRYVIAPIVVAIDRLDILPTMPAKERIVLVTGASGKLSFIEKLNQVYLVEQFSMHLRKHTGKVSL